MNRYLESILRRMGTFFILAALSFYSISPAQAQAAKRPDSSIDLHATESDAPVRNHQVDVTNVPAFNDVPSTYWAFSYIEQLYGAGITSGCGNGNYCPEQSVSRAQMAVFLERSMHGLGFTPPPATGTKFGDVTASYWAAAWIEHLAADGITGGCGNGDYCPDADVTRAQMAVFLLRAYHGTSYTQPPALGTIFTDVPLNYWAGSWIEELSDEDITGGCGTGTYCPDNPVTRAQMAVFLVKTFNYSNNPPVVVSDMPSLIAAINQANVNNSGWQIINLTNGIYTLTSSADGSNAFPPITSPIAINGNGSTIQRDGTAPVFRFFDVASGGKLALNGLTLTGGLAPDDGGAIYNNGSLVLTNSTISNNSAPTGLQYPYSRGGGIFSNSGSVTVNDSTFLSNTVDRYGGAFFISSGSLDLNQSTLSSNTATSFGGAIEADNGSPGNPAAATSIIVLNSLITNSSANFSQAIDANTLEVENTTISGSRSLLSWSQAITNQTEAISVSSLIFENSILYENLNGGIYIGAYGSSHIVNSCILGNIPDNQGYVVDTTSSSALNAANNYWGQSDGPSGAGLGSGDSVSPNINFAPFLNAPTPNCPAASVITGFVANSTFPHYLDQPNQFYAIPNGQIPLNAIVYGANGFDRSVDWTITSGGGNLSANTGPNILFTAPSTNGATTIRATAHGDSTFYTDLTLNTVTVSIVVARKSATVLIGSYVPLIASVVLNGTSLDDDPSNVVWSILNGGGNLTYPIYPNPGATFDAPASAGSATVRVAAKVDPTQYFDIPITITSDPSAPVTCNNTIFPSDAESWTVSTTGLQANYPYITDITLTGVDALIGQTATLTISAQVVSPATIGISSASMVITSDHQTSTPIPLSLISGTDTNGQWQANWILDDTHCNNYQLAISVVNSVHTTSDDLSVR